MSKHISKLKFALPATAMAFCIAFILSCGTDDAPSISCPEGQTWNGTSCMMSCQPGTTYDGNTNTCKVDAQCPIGQTSDGTSCKSICQSGTTYDVSTNSCITGVACPAGQLWNGVSCVAVTCPSGTVYDENTNTCVPEALEVTCPAGTDWNGTNCVRCPVNTTLVGSSCVGNLVVIGGDSANTQCPLGTKLVNGACVAGIIEIDPDAPKKYCDYGIVTTAGGGCYEIGEESDCDLEWGIVADKCGRTDLQYCDFGPVHSLGGGCYIYTGACDLQWGIIAKTCGTYKGGENPNYKPSSSNSTATTPSSSSNNSQVPMNCMVYGVCFQNVTSSQCALSGGNAVQSCQASSSLQLYCDYGPPHTYGGGCDAISNASQCNLLDGGSVTNYCGRMDRLYCDYGSLYNSATNEGGCHMVASQANCDTEWGNVVFQCSAASVGSSKYSSYPTLPARPPSPPVGSGQLYCDYGPKHTHGGGCEAISNASQCSLLDGGLVSNSCGRKDRLYCDYGPPHSAGGGCHMIASQANCDTEWGVVVTECPLTSL